MFASTKKIIANQEKLMSDFAALTAAVEGVEVLVDKLVAEKGDTATAVAAAVAATEALADQIAADLAAFVAAHAG